MSGMKKILFVIEDLKPGGVEVSLVNLLNLLDFETHKFKVTVIMWGNHYENIGLLRRNERIKIKIVRPRIVKLLYPVISKLIGTQKAEFFKNVFTRIAVINAVKWERADVIIRYHQAAIKTLFTHIRGKTKKIAWYHSSKFNDYYLNEKYTEHCDRVVVVNDSCKEVIAAAAPYLADKLCVVSNIIPAADVVKRSKETVGDLFLDDAFNIVTCGRLDPEKGIDIAIKAARILKNRIPNMKWYIIGDAAEDRLGYSESLKEMVKDEGIERTIIFAGQKSNPYPYFRNCDLYVQPSREESWCLTIAEAQICGAAVVSTDTIGARYLIEKGKTGLITQCDENKIADMIYLLYENRDLLRHLRENTEKIDFDKMNNAAVESFYNLVGV